MSTYQVCDVKVKLKISRKAFYHPRNPDKTGQLEAGLRTKLLNTHTPKNLGKQSTFVLHDVQRWPGGLTPHKTAKPP